MIDEYESDVTATTPTLEVHSHEAMSQAGQIMRQMEGELERNRLRNAGVKMPEDEAGDGHHHRGGKMCRGRDQAIGDPGAAS